MPDLSKHLARAEQALERRNYDLAIEICAQMVDIAPDELKAHSIHLEAARRKAKESAKGWGLPGLSLSGLSKDPHKLLLAAFKKVSGAPETKALAEAGDASLKLGQTVKTMGAVAIFYYEEIRKSGLFNDKVLWNLAHVYFERFNEVQKKDKEAAKGWLEKAINTMGELEKAMPHHNEAPKVVKNWEAQRSILRRNEGGSAGEYRSQLASDDKSRRQEKMNQMFRTEDDARDVLAYIDDALKTQPQDKALWVKKADIHFRMNQFAETRAALEKGQAIDVHDFTITMKLGDLRMKEMEAALTAARAAGRDTAAAEKDVLTAKVEEYRRRIERQPTDLNHRYNLGESLYRQGNIDQAASEFQRTVNDPKFRRNSHRYLGYCFTKKKLLDLASGQYAAYLQLAEDDLAEEAKEVRYQLARVYESLGKHPDAIANYEKLVAIDLGFRDAADRLTNLRSGGSAA